MLPACLGLIPFGMVCGVGAAAAGASWLAALGMSAIIFSGAAQILAAQLLAGGAPLLVIVLTCSVLGLRFLMYSAAMAPYLKGLSPRWQHALAFLLTDQAFASAIRRFDVQGRSACRRAAFSGLRGCAVRVLASHQHDRLFRGQPDPCVVVAGIRGAAGLSRTGRAALRNVPTIVAAIVAGVAVVALDGLPMKLNLIAAGVIGIVAGTIADVMRERWTRR